MNKGNDPKSEAFQLAWGSAPPPTGLVFDSPEFQLEFPAQERLKRVLSEAESECEVALKSPAGSLLDYEDSKGARDTYRRKCQLNACHQLVRSVYFEYLRAYMNCGATSAQIRASSACLYIELAKRVFHKHLNLRDWDPEAAWRGFSGSLGQFILNLPEWGEYVSALKNLDDREACVTSAGPEEPAKFEPTWDEFLVSIMDDASSGPGAELRTGLLKLWQSGISWQQAKYGGVTGLLEKFVCAVLELGIKHLPTNAEASAKPAAETLIHQIVQKVLPPVVMSDEIFNGPRLLTSGLEESSTGLWELVMAETWSEHCAARPADRNRTETWRVLYHLAWRFPTKRARLRNDILRRLRLRLKELESPTPGDETVYNPCPEPPYWSNPDPLYFFKGIHVEGMSSRCRDRIAAGLLEVHSANEEGLFADFAGQIECIRRAYNCVAQEYANSDLLTPEQIDDGIPATVFAASVGGQWRFPVQAESSQSVRATIPFGPVWTNEQSRSLFFSAIDGRISYWRAQLLRGSHSPRAADRAGGSETGGVPEEILRPQVEGQPRKGDPVLLKGKDAVSFRTAESYLGITDRQRQNLIKDRVLKVVGKGHNRKITTSSLRKCLPPENPK